jgi:hypothetical protein
MNIEISVPEALNLIKEPQGNPSRIFEIIGMSDFPCLYRSCLEDKIIDLKELKCNLHEFCLS